MNVLEEYANAEAAKQSLELELEALAGELTSGNNPGVRGPLVDADGFPRSDIDVLRVRQLRHELAVKRTDHQQVMRTIERLLPQVFELKSGQKQPHTETKSEKRHQEEAMQKLETQWKHKLLHVAEQEKQLQPFAVVQSVQNESPAEAAGLQLHDQVLKFGSADATNHRELQAVKDIVLSNVGKGIRVLVRRQQEVLAVELTPQSWKGPSVLGCLLQPM